MNGEKKGWKLLVTKKVSIVLRADFCDYGTTGKNSTEGSRHVYAL